MNRGTKVLEAQYDHGVHTMNREDPRTLNANPIHIKALPCDRPMTKTISRIGVWEAENEGERICVMVGRYIGRLEKAYKIGWEPR